MRKQSSLSTRNIVWPAGRGAVRAASFPARCPHCGSQRTQLVAHASTSLLRYLRCLQCRATSVVLDAGGATSTGAF
jgi:hypothetical protein